MFGSLGFNEMVVIFVVALIVFGPRRLPEIARTIGQGLAQFRRSAMQLRETVEREVEVTRIQEAVSELRGTVDAPAAAIRQSVGEALTVARDVPAPPGVAAPAPAPAEPAPTAASDPVPAENPATAGAAPAGSESDVRRDA